MDLQEIKNIWSDYDKKLQQNYKLNLHLVREMNMDKAASALRRVTFGNVIGLLIYIFMLLWLGSFIGDNIADYTLSIPAFLAFGMTQAALIWTIYHLTLIGQIDYGEPITAIQKKIEKLRVSKMRFNQFVFLACYIFMMSLTVVFFKVDLFALWQHAPWVIIIHWIFALAWFPIGLWILRKYQDKDLNSKFWIKLRDDSSLTEESVSKDLNKAIGFLDRIRAFEMEENQDETK